MSVAKSVLSLVKGQDQYIKELPLEDGRISFAVDSKKIYLDCDFEDLHGNTYEDRLSFGGNTGIYFGVRIFSTDEIEANTYNFNFPDEFNGDNDEAPEIDDVIINIDGCFYRVISVEKNNDTIIIGTSKLTVAGSGGGGAATGLTVARDPNQVYNIIKAAGSIPIGFKVSDALENTEIDVEVFINDVRAGVFRKVDQDVYTTIDLKNYSSYFTSNIANTVKLRFTNEYEHAATLTLNNIRLIELSLIAPASLGVVNTQNASINYQPYGGSSMYERYLNIRVYVENTGNPIISQKLSYDATIDNNEIYPYTINLNDFVQGNYTVVAWLSAIASIGDEEELISPQVRTTFTYQDINSNIPMLSASLDRNTYEQYETAVVNYLIAYSGTLISTVHLTAYCDDELINDIQTSVSYNNNHTWNVLLSKAGIWSFNVTVEDYDLSYTISNITVTPQNIQLPEIDVTDSSLQLYLSAAGRSNDEAQPNVWEYKNIKSQFENFNWNTNGWFTDENQITSLHLTNGAKLTIPYAVFETDATNANSGGKAIEIVYKLSNIRDENAIFIKMASEYNDIIRTGIIGTGTTISLNTRNNETYKKITRETSLADLQEQKHNGLQAYIGENERMHITFSIQTKNTNNTNANFIYTYVNGILSSLKKYDNSDQIIQIPNDPSYIIIDSTYGDIDIYSIRVYNKYIADSIVLNNYAADLPTVEQKMFVKTNNDILVGGQISLNRVAELGNIPYLVITDLREVKDKKASTGIIGQTAALTTGKKDFRWCPCYYVDPEDQKHLNDENYIKRSFGSPTELIEAVQYGQGTSSMAFPVKNFRLRFKNKKDKYSLKPAVPLLSQEEEVKWEALPKVALFTFKADYMDSSMSHNTGTGNALAALYDSINLKTPAQIAYPDRTICTNVVGRPCIVFWRTGEIGTETFIGRYNFNTDKAEHELFGFFEDDETNFGKLKDSQGNLKWGFQSTTDESKYWDGEWNEEKQKWDTEPLKNKIYYIAPNLEAEWEYNGIEDGGAAMTEALKNGPLYEYVKGPRTIQCWEFLDNSSALDNFRTNWYEEEHPDYDSKTSWVTSFESRYPEYQETQYGSTDKKYQYCSDFRAFSRLINWINSTNQMQATNEEFETPIALLGTTYTSDTKEYRLAKFKSEINQYMVLDFVIFYYILTQVLLMVDNRAKNMMMCSYDLDVDAGTGHWFPIFYDMDTILGVNNQGSLVFSYSENDATTRVYNAGANYGYYDNNNNWIPNTEYSVLWCNLREGFQNEIATKYQELRNAGKLSVNYLTQCYNKQQSNAFAEIYDNQDGIYKFIRPLTEQSKVLNLETGQYETVTSDYLYVEQGTREYHRTTFLTKRLNLLDSQYHYYADGEDIYIRANGLSSERTHPDPHPFQFTFTAQDYQYGTYVYGRAQSDTELLPNVPTLSNMPVGENDTANNLEVWLYNLDSIYDIGDLSDKFAENIDIKHVLKLRTLKVGNSDSAYKYKTNANMVISGLEKLPLLESIDVNKITFKDTTLDLSNNIYLNSVYAKGSNLTSLTFAAGANIQHLELPGTLTTLTLKDFLFYDTTNNPSNLQIEDYSKLITVNVEGCPLVNTQALIETIMAQDTTQNGQLISIRLPDINWRIDTINENTCELIEDIINNESVTIINDIKILDYATKTLEAIDNMGQTITPSATNNEYFGGTIIINNDNYLVNDIYIKRKYSRKFPKLNIIYTNNNNIVASYDILIHSARAVNEIVDSVVLDLSEAIGFNLKNYLENIVTIPTIEDDYKWTYTFKGWTKLTSTLSNNNIEITNALNNGYIMYYNEDNNTYIADENCPTALTSNDYMNRQLHLYPVFEMKLRQFTVSYMYTEYGVEPEEIYTTMQFNYGDTLTLPSNLPAIVNLNPYGDNDKSKTTIQLLTTFQYDNKPYTDLPSVVQNLKLYPIYSNPTDMNMITNPPINYFDTQEPTITTLIASNTFDDENGNTHLITDGVEAIIKENVTVEAICVPRIINNKYVVSIKNRSPYVKRIYFEPGSVIRYISGTDAGFNGSTFSTTGTKTHIYNTTTGKYELASVGITPTHSQLFKGFIDNDVNTVLEYIDLGALTQLELIGGIEGSINGLDINAGIFRECPNLYIKSLPDNLKFISGYTFFNDSSIAIAKLPTKLIVIGTRAFSGCTNLTTVEFTPAGTSSSDISSIINTYNSTMIAEAKNNEDVVTNLDHAWPLIGASAFVGCTNLILKTRNVQNDTLIDAVLQNIATIGDYAFKDCTALKFLTKPEDTNSTLQYIGTGAFQNCNTLNLSALPTNLRYIGNNAFQGSGNFKLTAIPMSIREMGKEIFKGHTFNNDNDYSLRWTFTSRLDENDNSKSVVHVSNMALSGIAINRLTFAFTNPDTISEEFWSTYKEKEPWSIALEDGINHAFGASGQRVNFVIIDDNNPNE